MTSFRIAWQTAALFGALVITTLTALAGNIVREQRLEPVSGAEETVRADVEWPIPKRYAVIVDDRDHVQTLHTVRDVLFVAPNQTRSFTIVELYAKALVLREAGTAREIVWSVGTTIAELPHRRLAATVLVKQLRYRPKPVERVTRPDPVLLSLDGTTAILEQQVTRRPTVPDMVRSEPPSVLARPPRDLPVFLRNVRIEEVSPNTYEVQGETLRGSLENAGQLFSDLKVMVSPTLTSQAGLGFQVSSALADGTLDQGGFTVTNTKLADMFGIQSGDTILKINGQPVTSPLNAWWVYQEGLIRNPNPEMRVDIRRGVGIMTKTYRIK